MSYLSHRAAAPALSPNVFVVSPTFVFFFPFPLAKTTTICHASHITPSVCVHERSDLPPLAVDVSDAVGQRVGSEQRGGALRPVHRHQGVLAHQHLAHVLGARHPDQRAAQ